VNTAAVATCARWPVVAAHEGGTLLQRAAPVVVADRLDRLPADRKNSA
jgi:hypothetical protein